jgi:Ras and EF-hand domain-containing protein
MRHLRQLEEETEAQVLKVEAKIKKQEAQRSDAEKAEIKAQLEAEMAELKANLAKLQRVSVYISCRKSSSDSDIFQLEKEVRNQEKPNDDLKERLNEVYFENRALKSNLTEAQTNLSLLRSEMASIKQNYEEKCYELEMFVHGFYSLILGINLWFRYREKSSVMDYAKEQENLARQIQMLQ